MKTSFLLPHRTKLPMLALLAGSVALYLLVDKANFELAWLHAEAGQFSNNNLTDEVALSGIILSLLAISCCRERVEDEYVRSIRLQSWVTAIFVNYGLVMLMIWTQYGLAFPGTLFYNLLTPVLIYLLVFYLRMHVLPRFNRNRVRI